MNGDLLLKHMDENVSENSEENLNGTGSCHGTPHN